MSNTLSKLLAFTAGAALGSAVTLYLVKAKYEKMTIDEINSIRELYANPIVPDYVDEDDLDDESDDEDDDEEDLEDENPGLREYNKLVKSYNYAAKPASKIVDKEEETVRKPYVIEPEEFDENGYETVSLYWFEDDVVTYALGGEVMDNVDEMIGEDAHLHFGEYEDETVYIRNDRLKTDFELCRDGRRYSEVN